LEDLNNKLVSVEPGMMLHQQRVINEKADLDVKIEKLRYFIVATNIPDVFGTLSEAEQSLLRIQYSVMQSYSKILGERIAHFVST
jgi:hypothetical protein